MSMIDTIAGFSTAFKQAEVQAAVAVKVLKMAQGQDQVAANLLADALESVEQSMEEFARTAGAQIDTLA